MLRGDRGVARYRYMICFAFLRCGSVVIDPKNGDGSRGHGGTRAGVNIQYSMLDLSMLVIDMCYCRLFPGKVMTTP